MSQPVLVIVDNWQARPIGYVRGDFTHDRWELACFPPMLVGPPDSGSDITDATVERVTLIRGMYSPIGDFRRRALMVQRFWGWFVEREDLGKLQRCPGFTLGDAETVLLEPAATRHPAGPVR